MHACAFVHASAFVHALIGEWRWEEEWESKASIDGMERGGLESNGEGCIGSVDTKTFLGEKRSAERKA